MLKHKELLQANKATRISSKDMFMLMALWMELYPLRTNKTLDSVRPTGCLLVDDKERIITLQCTGESHAIIRAILQSRVDPQGCDLYVSRYPCSMCTKMMVQAGIKKVYYFPAKDWEIDWESYCKRQDRGLAPGSPTRSAMLTMDERISEKRETNLHSVSRLIANNPISMSKYIPVWGNTTILTDIELNQPSPWEIDEELLQKSSFVKLYESLTAQFKTTVVALKSLQDYYSSAPVSLKSIKPLENVDLYRHAVVLAHIAAKRTDDAKVGVGAVLVNPDGSYGSVGWNGFPSKADILDYPQAGADDLFEQELKYDYILHAEQNALLWRTRPFTNLDGCTMVTTKLPCDECSPVMYDCGIRMVVANSQMPKSNDDPSRLRGLTYDKIEKLMNDIWVFH